MLKSFSKFDSHVHNRKTASSSILLALNEPLEKIMVFLCFQIVCVNANHHHFHLLTLMSSVVPWICWRKCCLGFWGKTPTKFTQDSNSHHTRSIILQWKNKCPALSSADLQNRNTLLSGVWNYKQNLRLKSKNVGWK